LLVGYEPLILVTTERDLSRTWEVHSKDPEEIQDGGQKTNGHSDGDQFQED